MQGGRCLRWRWEIFVLAFVSDESVGVGAGVCVGVCVGSDGGVVCWCWC